MKENVL